MRIYLFIFSLLFSIVPTVGLAVSVSSLPILSTTSGTTDDRTGYSISTKGDLNGDGYDDLVIGSYQADANGVDAGAVYIIYGSSTAITTADLSSAVSLIGEGAVQYAGISVDIAGDLNGDGYDDLLVGAKGYSSNKGVAYLIYGQASHLTPGSLSAYPRFVGEGNNQYAGETVAGIGDINNDGYDDILIGAKSASGENTSSGAAYLIYGQAAALSSAALASQIKFSGEDSGSQAGFTLAGLGDINHDGYADFAVGAFNNSLYNLNDGAVYLLYGQSSLYTSANLSSKITFYGSSVNHKLGYGLGALGDINGDNYDDFMISARRDDLNNAGRAHILYGQPTQYTSVDVSTFPAFTSSTDAEYTGQGVVALGDLNADGYDDFAFSAARHSGNFSLAGRVFVVFGQVTAFTDTSTNSLTTYYDGANASDRLGEDLSAGDLNGDGFLELLLSAVFYDVTPSGNEGAVYAAYLAVDSDRDGVAGTTGVLVAGTDCNDANNAITANQTYYQDSDGDGLGSDTTTSSCVTTAPTGYVANSNDTNDSDADNDGTVTTSDCNDADATLTVVITYYQDSDGDGQGSDVTTTTCSLTPPTGYVANSNDDDDANSGDDSESTPDSAIEIGNDLIDNDGDGIIDEVNTLTENGIHPTFGTSDRTATDTYAANITNIVGTIDGDVLVTFSDGAVYLYDLFTVTSTKLTRVVAYDGTGTIAVTQPRARSLALVNAYTGEVLNRVTLAKTNFTQQSLKALDLRSNGSIELVVTAKRKATIKLSLLTVDLTAGTMALADQATIRNHKIAVHKTAAKQKLLLLKNAKGKILLRYQATKRDHLVEL